MPGNGQYGSCPGNVRAAGARVFLSTAVMTILLMTMSATTYVRNAFFAVPLTLWTDVARKAPNRERPHYNLGTELKYVGRLEEAEREWERTLELNPRHSHALNQMGSLWFLRKDLEKAERYYRAAVQSDPNNIEACYNLAMTLENMGRREQALDYYILFLQKATPEFRDLALAVSRKVEYLKMAGKDR